MVKWRKGKGKKVSQRTERISNELEPEKAKQNERGELCCERSGALRLAVLTGVRLLTVCLPCTQFGETRLLGQFDGMAPMEESRKVGPIQAVQFQALQNS